MTDKQISTLDVSSFPLVRVRAQDLPPGYARGWVVEMDALLRRNEPFTLLMLEAHREESHEDRKTKTMWIKANKREFARLCRGMVAVEASKVKRLALRAQGAVLAATFGLRFAVVADAAEAERAARRLLAGEALADAAE